MYERERELLVRSLVSRGDITQKRVIEAMLSVERHLFVPKHLQALAYRDTPLEIGFGQTISAPHMVGIMVERLDLMEGHKVLEIGGGSGYHAAIAAKIVGPSGHVYSVERVRELAERAEENIQRAGLDKVVTVIVGDGSKGLAEYAPYDRIFVSCAAPDIPPPLIEQLKPDGKLLIPVGNRYIQSLVLVKKHGGRIEKEHSLQCVFVPMVGEYGYRA